MVDGEVAYFSSDGRETGVEPWVTDGSPAGTALLADLCPGECDSSPTYGARIPAGLVFSARSRLYRSDGTAAGTLELASLCSQDCLAPAGGFTAAGGRAFFSAYDEEHGVELWATNGTVAGTGLVVDLRPGSQGSYPEPATAFGDLLYFESREGWRRTDGTAAGTEPAAELVPPGLPQEAVGSLAVAVGRLFFVTSTDSGRALWTLDRPKGTARLLRDGFESVFLPFSAAGGPTDHLFFVVSVKDGRYEPWVTDGTPDGTLRVTPPGVSTDPFARFAALDGRAVFEARDSEHGEELWTTDGTPAGTGLLEDVVPDGDPSSNPRSLVAFNGAVYFIADAEAGAWLWRHRPGQGPAERVASVHAGATLSVRAGRLFVRGHSGRGLAVLDPANPELAELVGFHVQPELVAVGERVLFTAPGLELWITDGTPGGTELVREWPGWCESDIGLPVLPTIELVGASGGAYFLVETDDCLDELWRSDGTAEGTVRMVPPYEEFEPVSLAPLGARQLVVRVTKPHVDGLWVLDATRHRTTEFFVDGLRWIHFLPSAGELAYFIEPHSGGNELWRTDGTRDGTFALARVGSVGLAGAERRTAAAGGRLFFSTRDGTHGEEPWVADGTVAGTHLVRDLRTGWRSSMPRALTEVAKGIAFAADDGVTGHEPWWSDGTPDGTVRLADVAPGRDASSPGAFAAVGDRVYFDADDGRSGRELWAVELSEHSPPPPDATPIDAPELDGFRLWVRITSGGSVLPARREPVCIPETVCVSGAVAGRAELFVRIVGPKPNGRLWPTLVRFSTSSIEVWIEQVSTGEVRRYLLEAATPETSSLDGLFDRDGFVP